MSRRARPTLRVLREDLSANWEDPHYQRRLQEGDLTALHPFTDLPHPLLQKAARSFGDEPDEDQHEGRIGAAEPIELLEIKSGQWRGGI